MIRYCFSTSGPVTAYQKSNGQWTVDGMASEGYLDGVTITARSNRPYNMSFYFTTNVNECLQRLKNNESDTTSVFLPIQTEADEYFVPHPIMSGKTTFVTAYNITQNTLEREDSATVVANFKLLDLEVYFGAISLLILFLVFIAIRLTMIHRYNLRKNFPMTYFRREISKVFYLSSIRFKFITALHSILGFYMITSFLCVYKTSHVLIDRPFYPKSYKDSLALKSSLAYVFDQYSDVSSTFKNAPPESIKAKLWSKLIASGRKDKYTGMARDPSLIPTALRKIVDEINHNKSILVTCPLITPLLLSAGCAMSPENELWVVKALADPCEHEVAYGHAVRKGPLDKWISSRILLLVETNLIAHGFALAFDQLEATGELVGTSKSHLWKQRVACADEDAFIVEPEVHAIPLFYFHSFFSACFVLWLFAFILNIIQIMCTRCRRKGWPRPARLIYIGVLRFDPGSRKIRRIRIR